MPLTFTHFIVGLGGGGSSSSSSSIPSSIFPSSNLRVHSAFYVGNTCLQSSGVKLGVGSGDPTSSHHQPTFYFAPLNSPVAVPLSTATSVASQPVNLQAVPSHADVSQVNRLFFFYESFIFHLFFLIDIKTLFLCFYFLYCIKISIKDKSYKQLPLQLWIQFIKLSVSNIYV
jgi:hypothetical protein